MGLQAASAMRYLLGFAALAFCWLLAERLCMELERREPLDAREPRKLLTLPRLRLSTLLALRSWVRELRERLGDDRFTALRLGC